MNRSQTDNELRHFTFLDGKINIRKYNINEISLF